MISPKFSTLLACAAAFTGALAQTRQTIRPAANNALCLAVSDTPNMGSSVVLEDCEKVDSQYKFWTQEGDNLILDTFCLDTLNSNFANGTAVQLWNCLDNDAQKWSLNGHLITQKPQNTTFCLDIPGGQAKAGANIEIWQCMDDDANAQNWVSASY